MNWKLNLRMKNDSSDAYAEEPFKALSAVGFYRLQMGMSDAVQWQYPVSPWWGWSLVLLRLPFSCHLRESSVASVVSDLLVIELNLDPYLVRVKVLGDIRPFIKAGFCSYEYFSGDQPSHILWECTCSSECLTRYVPEIHLPSRVSIIFRSSVIREVVLQGGSTQL